MTRRKQSADTNQVIVHQPLLRSDNKNQPGTSAFAKWNAGAAAPDSGHNLVNQIGVRMWKGDLVLHRARVRLLSREDLLEEFCRIVDLAVGREQLDHLTQGVCRFPRAQLQRDLSFIEKNSQRDRHERQRDLLDYPGKLVIQLTGEPWQPTTSR